MTAVETMTPDEIRRDGMHAVRERLGVVGAVRFLQQFNPEGRDYTAERAAWADSLTQEEIVSAMDHLRDASPPVADGQG